MKLLGSERIALRLRRLLLISVLSVGLCGCLSRMEDPAEAASCSQSVNTVDSLINEGSRNYNKGFYANALNSLTEALEIAERESIMTRLPMIYNDIGKVYCTWNHDRLGIEYFKKGLQTPTVRQNQDTYRKLLINVQGAAFNLNDLRLMRTYYDEMKKIAPTDSLLLYFMYLNGGLLLSGEGKSREAVAWFDKAAEYAESKRMEPLFIGSAYGYIADHYEATDPAKAIAYRKKSIADNNIPAYYKRDVLRHLSSASEALGRDADAVNYSRQYLELSDSLFKEGDMNRARDTQILYERKLDQDKISRLDRENREREYRIHVQTWIMAIVIAAAIVLAMLFLFIYVQKRRLRQSYESLFERNKEILHIQEIDRMYRLELEKRINELESSAPSAPEQSRKSVKQQSVDKLTEERRLQIIHAIEQVMDDTAAICDADFSIEKMADLTGVNSRYLSQVINDTYGQNFRTLLNERRIREVQRRLLDTETWGNYTIQAIIQSAGYKSQSNFNQLFKKHTGVTPSMYHKMALAGRGKRPGELDDN